MSTCSSDPPVVLMAPPIKRHNAVINNNFVCPIISCLLTCSLLYSDVALAVVASDPFSGYQLLKVVASLALVIVVIVVATIYLKRLQRFTLGSNQVIKVVYSVQVGPRERVVLIEVGQEQLLLGVGNSSVNLIKTLEQPLDIGTAAGSVNRFSVYLQKAKKSQRADYEQ